MAQLNADLAQRALINTQQMEWQASPSPGVWRKRLDLIGSVEAGRVTSIVRYDPACAFPVHEHPDGEEILVLAGTFSDEFGDYPAGSYLLNPHGFRHAPFSQRGCTIFVKLRQYAGLNREHILINTNELPWRSTSIPGIEHKLLYASSNYPDRVELQRWHPGVTQLHHVHHGGEELFVLDGTFADEDGYYPTGTWLRHPHGSRHTPYSETGCVLYVKTGWH